MLSEGQHCISFLTQHFGRFSMHKAQKSEISLNKSAIFLKFKRNKEVTKIRDPEFCIRGK